MNRAETAQRVFESIPAVIERIKLRWIFRL